MCTNSCIHSWMLGQPKLRTSGRSRWNVVNALEKRAPATAHGLHSWKDQNGLQRQAFWHEPHSILISWNYCNRQRAKGQIAKHPLTSVDYWLNYKSKLWVCMKPAFWHDSVRPIMSWSCWGPNEVRPGFSRGNLLVSASDPAPQSAAITPILFRCMSDPLIWLYSLGAQIRNVCCSP